MEFLKKIWRWAGSSRGKYEAVPSGDGGVLALGMGRGASFSDDYIELKGETLVSGDFSRFQISTRRDGVKSAIRVSKRVEIDASDLFRLRNEAKLFYILNHDHIASLHGWYEEQDVFYTALELCSGGELFEYTAKRRGYSEDKARNIIRALLTAVDYLHRQGIVLRNLKPEHLLLSDESEHAKLKIADLRFATKDGKNRFPLHDQTRSAEYNAPETSKEICGPPADMWCVGTITYILLGGYLPFHGGTQVQLLRNIKRGKFEFHDENWRLISPSVKDLIQRMLLVDPSARITAAEALEHEWMTLRSGELAGNNLEHNLGLFRSFNARRKFKQAVSTVVFLVYASKLRDDTTTEDRKTAEYAFRVAESFIRDVYRIEGGRQQPTDKAETATPATSAATSLSSSTGVSFFSKLDSVNESLWNESTSSRATHSQTEGAAELNASMRSSSMDISHAPRLVQPRAMMRSSPPEEESKPSGDTETPSPRTLDPHLSELPCSGSTSRPTLVSLADTLGPEPKTFDESVKHGVRLSFQEGCSSNPSPAGPIYIEHAAVLLPLESQWWLVGTKVTCAPKGARFSRPLLLDFFVEHVKFQEDSEPELDTILKDFKVLRREGPDERWSVMPRDRLKLIRQLLNGSMSTQIRVEVDHFTWFTCCTKMPLQNTLHVTDQSNRRTIVVKNICGALLLVVSVPASLTDSECSTMEVGLTVNPLGAGAGANFGRSHNETRIHLPASSSPNCETIPDKAEACLDLERDGQSVMLLLCTLEGLPEDFPEPPSLRGQRSGISYSEPKPDRVMCPPLERECGDGESSICMKFWAAKNSYGGRQIWVLPEFARVGYPMTRQVPKSGRENLMRHAIELYESRRASASPPAASPGSTRTSVSALIRSILPRSRAGN